MAWKWHILHEIWPHHVKEREILSLHWKFEALPPRRSVTMKFYISSVLKCEQNWYAHWTIFVVIFFLAEVKILRTLKEKKSFCPIYKNAHISWTLWATPMIFCGKTDFTKRDQAKKVGLLKMCPTGPTSPTNLPDGKTKKWHNFWMSKPIWLKFCMKVVEEYPHY